MNNISIMFRLPGLSSKFGSHEEAFSRQLLEELDRIHPGTIPPPRRDLRGRHDLMDFLGFLPFRKKGRKGNPPAAEEELLAHEYLAIAKILS